MKKAVTLACLFLFEEIFGRRIHQKVDELKASPQTVYRGFGTRR